MQDTKSILNIAYPEVKNNTAMEKSIAVYLFYSSFGNLGNGIHLITLLLRFLQCLFDTIS